ncbi:zinc ribbon domain-containing protein [Kitasatospora sp. NPDC056531]|uniref:zinc ribbon domain-containing protein n=1 Tax=Kitasatospora sp. NPDC056531 TaxID=3345856 RepID=UPI0036AAF304
MCAGGVQRRSRGAEGGPQGRPGVPDVKAARYGRHIGTVHRAFPSSQLCSECGHRDGPKPLAVREWAGGACGVRHDRDLNAARNILAAGQADRLNAPGGPVRPGVAIPRRAQPVERGSHLGDQRTTGDRAAGAEGIPAPRGRGGCQANGARGGR